MRVPFWNSLALVLTAAVAAGCGGARPAEPESLVGMWAGEGRQWNSGDRTQPPDETWPVRVTMTGTVASGYTGTIAYPEQQCGGSLVYVGPNTAFDAQPGDAVFREEITYGTDRCVDGGTVLLRPSRRSLVYAWAIDGRPTVAAARLERED